MQIDGETYVPWDHFKTQMNLATRYRETLEFIRDNAGNMDAPDPDDVAREALRLDAPAFGCLRCFPSEDCPSDCVERNGRK